ncbi:MAG: efflux RND transporter periplasmic adaptor subunit, partial [Syntrophales bacterium]|nr:efflux RND transporter periplasmic adaptor subunit [Syntrophales bacterium]
MKKFIIAGILILMAIAAVAFFKFRNNGDELRFRTERISRGDVVSTVTATGTVNAVTTVLVGTQVSGTIKHIYADFNSSVKRGQLIATIDPATFEAQVAQARANSLVAKANVAKAEAVVLDARRTMNRSRELFSSNLIARSDLDTSETNYASAEAQLAAAKAQVVQTEAAARYAETNLKYTRIISPVEGVVISRNVDVGQTVAASFQTPTLFNIAQDLTKMQVNASVDEADIGKIVVGQGVNFTVDAYPEMTFKGGVSQVRIAPVTVQNVVTYDVVIRVDNIDLKLKPGMTANVSIIVAEKKDVLRIPDAAMRFRPNGPDRFSPVGGRGVWVFKDQKLRRIRVVTGIS